MLISPLAAVQAAQSRRAFWTRQPTPNSHAIGHKTSFQGTEDATTTPTDKTSPAPSSLDDKLTAITAYLEDQKALDPFLLKFNPPNAVADAVIVASATSRRHAQGLARGLLKTLSDAGADFSHMEGFETAQWILLDCNDVLIHIFLQETRDLYRLEELCLQANDIAKENKL